MKLLLGVLGFALGTETSLVSLCWQRYTCRVDNIPYTALGTCMVESGQGGLKATDVP